MDEKIKKYKSTVIDIKITVISVSVFFFVCFPEKKKLFMKNHISYCPCKIL